MPKCEYGVDKGLQECIGKTCADCQPPAASAGYGGVDLEALRLELTDGFILREYAQLFAPLKPDYRESAVGLYRNDANFHARVCQVVSGVMSIVQKYTP